MTKLEEDAIYSRGYSDGLAKVMDETIARVKEFERWQTDATRSMNLMALTIEGYEAKLTTAENETLEQARLNGMGSEREARLMARVSELERHLKEANQDCKDIIATAEKDITLMEGYQKAYTSEKARVSELEDALRHNKEAQNVYLTLGQEIETLQAKLAAYDEATKEKHD